MPFTLYESLEERQPSKFLRKCIDGRFTGRNKCVGYCLYEEHEGFLTKELRQEHDCINKNCCYYIGKGKRQNDTQKNKEKDYEILLKQVNDYLGKYEGFKIIRVEEFRGTYILKYITISEYSIKEIETELKEKMGLDIKLENLNYSFDNCIKLLFDL